MSCDKIYISLGGDCAVAHNLRKLDLVQEAFPFDWIKINSVKMIKETLELSFSNFFENYSFIKQSTNFFNQEDPNKLSLIRLKLSNGIILPHETVDNIFDKKKYESKYIRRIERFKEIVRDGIIQKVFVWVNDKITDIDKLTLYSALEEYGCLNYSLIFIDYSKYNIEVNKFNWKREYIDWENIILK